MNEEVTKVVNEIMNGTSTDNATQWLMREYRNLMLREADITAKEKKYEFRTMAKNRPAQQYGNGQHSVDPHVNFKNNN